jgi:hypothetical protein
MKHLLSYLQDDQTAADDVRQVRWPDGITCPRCGTDAVEPRCALSDILATSPDNLAKNRAMRGIEYKKRGLYACEFYRILH